MKHTLFDRYTAHSKATLKTPFIATITDDVGVLVGTIAKAGVTDDATLLISGTAKSGVKVKVFDGKTSLGTIPVDESGQWRFTTPVLKDGTHTFTVVAIDASGKTSSTSDAYKITVDTQAPIGPQFTLTDDAGRLTGIISSGTRTDDSTPSLTGNTESNASISVFDGKKLLGTTKADPTGAWSYTPDTLKDGTHTLKAIATDAAGNSSAASTSFTFVVDSQPPKPPTLDTVTDDQGLIKGVVPDQGATDDTRLKLAGTAPGKSTVELFDGSLSLGTTTAGNKGNWTFTTPTLADGQHLFTATTVDTLGTASVASKSVTVTVDTQPPAPPTISSVLDNVGKKKGDVANGGKTDDTSLQLKGTVDPGSTVILYDYADEIGQTTADGKGNWSFTTDTLANGSTHVLAAAVRDAAGNLSDIGASRTVSIDTGEADTLAPFAPTIESITDNYGDKTGLVPNKGRTDDATLTLNGTAEANSTVEVFNGVTRLGTVKASKVGDWVFTTPALTDGTQRLTATATDAAKNTSDVSNTFVVTTDTTPPATPVIARVNDDVGSFKGVVSNPGAADDQTLTLSGQAEALSTVELFDGKNKLTTLQADKSGNWIYTTLALSEGRHTFTAKATDGLGNTSPGSAEYTVSIDTTTAPTLILSTDKTSLKAGETANVSFTFSETPTRFDATDITISGGTLSALSGTGLTRTAIFTPTSNTNTLTASLSVAANSYTDPAGNNGAASNTLSIKGDTQAPSLTISSDKTSLKAGETANVSFTFSEIPTGFDATDIATSGGTLSALSGTGLTRTAIFTPTANTNTLTASLNVAANTYTDAAGNNGSASNTLSIKGDTQAPSLTISSDKTSLKAGETAAVSFTFSEIPTGFDATDITTSGGTLSALSGNGLTRTAIFTPTANTNDLTASLSVTANSYTDAAGNNGAASNTLSIKGDTQAPGLTISSDKTSLKAGETASVSFTFSEIPTGFDATDITISGGTLSALSGSGLTRTATFTPTANTNTLTASLNVAANTYTDAVGNNGSASNTLSIKGDTQAPSLTISSDKTSLKAGETATVSFSFSEVPTGFDATDITTSGGTLSALSGSGLTRTAIFTPTANTNTLTASLSVAANTYTDAAGNSGVASNTLEMYADTLAPSLKISSDKTSLKAGETAAVTFTFNEIPSGFTEYDISTSGGTLSNFNSGRGGNVYTALFTPTANTNNISGSISVTAESYTDTAGNKGGAGSLALTADTKAPSLTISHSSSGTLSTGQTATITFNFDEQPVGFDATDISVSAGSIDSFSGTGLTRTVLYTPPSNASGTASITVETGRYTDAAGNGGGAGNTSVSYNTVVASSGGSSGGGGGSAPATPSVTSLSGKIIDGYISGATVFADANGNGVRNSGEAQTTTTGVGNFTLTGGSGTFIASGGTDISTNLPFIGEFKAPAGSTVITPLTTLVTAIQVANPTFSVSQAQTRVATALGFNANTDFTTLDPVARLNANSGDTTALNAQKAAVMVANIMVQTANAVQGADSGVSLSTVASQTATQIAGFMMNNTGVVSLTDTTTLNTIVTGTISSPTVGLSTTAQTNATSAVSAITTVMAATNSNVQSQTSLTDITKSQVVAQNDAAEAIQTAVNTGNSTTALASYTGTALTMAVSNATVGIIDTSNVGLIETISGAGTSTATSKGDIFTINAGNYSHTISGFNSGDKLVFFSNAILNVIPDANNTDGNQIIEATDSITGATASITLSGLSSTQDAGLFNIPSFATTFGANTITTNSSTTSISASGISVATAAADVFNFAAGTYTSTITGFASGDRLRFFADAILNVESDSNQADGIQQITATDPVTQAVTTVILTGLTSAQDAALFNVSSFNTVFGNGAIA